jgi:hypothetical protein
MLKRQPTVAADGYNNGKPYEANVSRTVWEEGLENTYIARYKGASGPYFIITLVG